MKAFPRDSAVAVAADSHDSFRLTIAGLVSRTLQFSLQDLRLNFSERSFDRSEGDRFPAGDRSWLGCSLNELLEFVGGSGQAHHIEFVCFQPEADRAFSVPIRNLEQEDIALVWEQDGKSLASAEGGPLLALVPTLEGYRVLPGVYRINLVIIPCSIHFNGPTPALAA